MINSVLIANRVIFFVLIFSLVPSLTSAEQKTIKINSNWFVSVTIDDFTDEKTCTVFPKQTKYSGVERILIRMSSSDEEPVAIIGSLKYINKIGVKYRVDKSSPVQLGKEYKFPKYADVFIVYGDEYEKLIRAFKAGREVVYQFTSKNRAANDKIYKFDLTGFTEAYKYAMKCAQ